MIGICISCYIGHISKLFELLDSIESQTLLPDKVVISCSSTPDSLKESLSFTKYRFLVEFYNHPDYKNASQNRNIAISKLLDMDYISFIDADDIMHPQRIELITRTLQETDCDILLHNYNIKPGFQPIEELSYRVNSLMKSPKWYGIEHIDSQYNLVEHIHHSQSTVKHHILYKVSYLEEDRYKRIEDSVFCSDVFSLENIKHAYIINKLTEYRPSESG